jgi:hypothetical protein
VTMVREQDVFFLAGPAADFSTRLLRGEAIIRWIKAAAAGVLAFAIGVLPQVIAYRALNGHHGPSRLVTRKMLWHAPHGLQVMFSPEHGLFVWTPLALIAVAGLVLLAAGMIPARGEMGGTERSRIATCLLLMVALQVYVSGAVDSWTVAGAFGQRRFVALTMILIVGLAAAWTWAAGAGAGAGVPDAGRPGAVYRRVAFGAAVVLCMYWNLALIALFGTRMMDRQRMEPSRNAYDAFVTLPRLAPALIWRYVAQRESFYERKATRSTPE